MILEGSTIFLRMNLRLRLPSGARLSTNSKIKPNLFLLGTERSERGKRSHNSVTGMRHSPMSIHHNRRCTSNLWHPGTQYEPTTHSKTLKLQSGEQLLLRWKGLLFIEL